MVDPLLFGRLASARRARPRRFKVLVNEDTLLPMMFLGLRKLGNICCGHKMFLNKIRNIFCVPDTKFLDEYLSENDVKSRFRFCRDCINYLADLLSDDLARNTTFRYAPPSPWALTIRPKNSGANFRKFPWANGRVFFHCGRH